MPAWLPSLTSFIAILAIVNPLGAVPTFLVMTSPEAEHRRRMMVRTAAITVFVVLAASAWTGNLILDFFGIRVASLRVGGGILVMMMALSMVQARTSPAKQTKEEADEAQQKENPAIVPIGIPLLAGPGAISLVIVDPRNAAGWEGRLGISLEVLLVALLTWIVLRLAGAIMSVIGETGLRIGTRLMGLILSAVAVELIVAGLKQLLPGLA